MNKLLIHSILVFILTSVNLSAQTVYPPNHKPQTVNRNLIINPPLVDFGDVLLSEIRTQLFELFNPTDQPKNISHYVTADDGSVNLNYVGRDREDSLFYTILPLQTGLVMLTFTPMEMGVWNEFMVIYDHSDSASYAVPLSANVLPNANLHLEVNPPEVNYGNVRLTETASFGINLYNPTAGPLNISHYVTADDGSVNLNYVGKNRADSLYYTILPDEHRTINAEFSPQELGEWSCDMYVLDVTNGGLYQIPMSARGVLPVFVNPPTGDYGNVKLGQSKQLSFEVHNASDSTLNISHYVTADDGSVNLNYVGRLMLDSLFYTIQPNGTRTVNSTFIPDALGNWDGMMDILVHNDNSIVRRPLNAYVELDIPNIYISVLPSQIKLNWANVPGATQYKIYCADRPDTTFTFLETVTENPVIYTPVAPRKFYQVKAKAPD